MNAYQQKIVDSDTKKYLYIGEENENIKPVQPYETLNNFISSGGLQVDVKTKINGVKNEFNQRVID